MAGLLDPLGWALLHSLWQGALVIAAVAVLRRGAVRPATSYVVGVAGLGAVFALFLGTFAWGVGGLAESTALPGGATRGWASIAPGTPADGPARVGAVVPPPPTVAGHVSIVPWLAVTWAAGFALMALQYGLAWRRTRRLATTGHGPVPAIWAARFAELAKASGATASVRLAVSELVDAPLALGVVRPLVLVPAGFLLGLPPAQVEAVLLHELAHIRRHDVAVGLVQSAIRAALYFNPAVRIMSRWVDEDRELACDDFAVARTGRPDALLRGLASLRLGQPYPRAPRLAMSATGGGLMARLERLAGRTPATPRARLSATVLAGALLGTTALLSAHAAPRVWAEPAPQTPSVEETGELAGGLPEPTPAPPMPPMPAIPAMPELPVLPAMPPIPPLPAIDPMMGDSEAFEAAMETWGERMEAWGETVEDRWGEDFETRMERWGERVEASFDKDFEARMEAWGERMEAWGESIEARGERIERLGEMSDAELAGLGLSRADVESYAESFGLEVADSVLANVLPALLGAEAEREARAEIAAERAAIDREAKMRVERALRERPAPPVPPAPGRTADGFDGNAIVDDLSAKLAADGLIEADARRYSFDIRPDRLRVNGRRLSDEWRTRYSGWLAARGLDRDAELEVTSSPGRSKVNVRTDTSRVSIVKE